MSFIPKHLRGYPQIREHNWLNHQLIVTFLEEFAAVHASGTLVDVGCGQKPYRKVFESYVSQHIGVDLIESAGNNSSIDVVATAYHTALKDSSCDIVLCTEVLEHLETPLIAIREMARILTKGGIVLLTAPFFWPIHEAPRDFFRYSEYGLRYLFEQGGFEIIEIRPLTGFVVTCTQMSIYFCKRFLRRPGLRSVGRVVNWGLQHLALKLNRYDTSTMFTNLYGLVARK